MANPTSKASQQLEQLIELLMATGQYTSRDELLIDALHSLKVQQRELAAIEESLDSLDRGEPGVSLDEAFEIVRKRHGIDAGA